MITYEMALAVEDYLRLRDAVGFEPLRRRQAEIGLRNSAYVVSARDGERVVGAARVVEDGGPSALITDVMVDPAYQGQHIGAALLRKLENLLLLELEPGEWKLISVLSAKGKEVFYRKAGFSERPNTEFGSGFSKRIENDLVKE